MKSIILTISFLLFAIPSYATTWTAASCESVDVQARISNINTVDGDTVIIPGPGPCTWAPNSVSISGKGIILRGPTSGQVTIINAGTAGQGPSPLIVTEDATHSVQVGFITWQEASGANNGNWYAITVNPAANGKPVLIHDNTCTGINCTRLARFLIDRGIYYKNFLKGNVGATTYLNRQAVSCKGGQKAWETLPTYGTNDTTGTNHLYIEDNIFWSINETMDIDDGCRVVVRHNIILSGHVGSHGQDTSYIGARYIEVYANIFGRDPATNSNQGGAYVGGRGGSWRIHNNVTPDYISPSGNAAEFGIIHYALNDVRYNLTVFWECWGSALNPVHGTNGTNMYTGIQYPAPHQAALGWDGGTGAGHYTIRKAGGVDQSGYVIEGYYYWNNSPFQVFSVNTASPNDCGATADAASGYFQVGRDIFNSAPAGYVACDSGNTGANGTPTISGYPSAAGTACNYPHACRSDVLGAACGGSGPPTNSQPTISILSPTPFYDTTAATINVSGVASDDVAVTAVTWANATTGGSGSATYSSGAWTITGMAVNAAVNTITVTVSDGTLTSAATLKVRRQTCTGSLPFIDTFTSSENWPSLGPCYNYVGSGQNYTIVSNQAKQTASGVFKMAIYTGQAISQDHYSKALIQTVNPSPGQKALRLCVASSGTAGQDGDRNGYALQVEGTGLAKWFRYKNGALDYDYGVLPTTNINGDTWTVVPGATTAKGQIIAGVLTAFINDIQVGPNIPARIPTETGLPNGGLLSGAPANCSIGNGIIWDSQEFGNSVALTDSEAPVVTISTTFDDVILETTIPTFAVIATDNVGVVSCTLSNSRIVGNTAMSLTAGSATNGTWTATNVALLPDYNTLAVACLDAQGLPDTDEVTVFQGDPAIPQAPSSLRGIF